MKTNMVVILLILVGILGFIIGYSIAPTDVSVVRHDAPGQVSSGGSGEAGGYGGGGEAGGYGGGGGYGAPAGGGGYGAPAAGGYGAPAVGGYGSH